MGCSMARELRRQWCGAGSVCSTRGLGRANIMTLEKENGVNETVYTVSNPGGELHAERDEFYCGLRSDGGGADDVHGCEQPECTVHCGGGDWGGPAGGAGGNDLGELSCTRRGCMTWRRRISDITLRIRGRARRQYQFFTEGAFHQNQLIVHGHVQTKAISLFGYYALNSAQGTRRGRGRTFDAGEHSCRLWADDV